MAPKCSTPNFSHGCSEICSGIAKQTSSRCFSRRATYLQWSVATTVLSYCSHCRPAERQIAGPIRSGSERQFVLPGRADRRNKVNLMSSIRGHAENRQIVPVHSLPRREPVRQSPLRLKCVKRLDTPRSFIQSERQFVQDIYACLGSLAFLHLTMVKF